MSKLKPAARLRLASLRLSAAHCAEWEDLFGLTLHIVRKNIVAGIDRRAFGYSPSDIIEMVNEALAFSWQRYIELRPKAGNAKTAVTVSARHGASKALAGKRFVPGTRGQRSVLTSCSTDVGPAYDLMIEHGYRAPDDRIESRYVDAELTILSLSPQLRHIARLLSQGIDKRTIADRCDCTVRTINNRCAAIRRELMPDIGYAVICSALDCFSRN